MNHELNKIAADQALGQRLRMARLRLGITELEAIDAAHVSLRTWRKYEAGGGGYLTLPVVMFAQRFGISLDWLLFGVGEKLPPCRKPRLAIVA